MILVDTSVWVDHLRLADAGLVSLLGQGLVCMHPMVLGELACGNLSNREQLLGLWRNLPKSAEATYEEALFYLSSHQLAGRGIGLVDLHLLASTQLRSGTNLWTRDKRLQAIADELKLAFIPH